MAFATTVRFTGSIAGPMRVTMGDWSGAYGDAPGTISVGGRYVGSLWFKNDTTSVNQLTSQVFPKVEWDGNNPGTLTVENQDAVTTGSFIIFSLGF